MTQRRVIALTVLCTTILVVACARRTPPPARAEIPPPAPVAEEPAPPPPPPPLTAAPAPPPGPAAALTEEEIFARKTLAELNAERPLSDVFFDFDQWQIRDDARAALQRNAEWLRRWTTTRITLEGHADERGTGEYNLALGDRRASAAKEYLASLGIASDRVLVVTKGEESPFCTEGHEGCWQQNRRGHFIFTAK